MLLLTTAALLPRPASGLIFSKQIGLEPGAVPGGSSSPTTGDPSGRSGWFRRAKVAVVIAQSEARIYRAEDSRDYEVEIASLPPPRGLRT